MFELKNAEELSFMTLESDVKSDMKNLVNFHRLKNSDFILESKMPELNQNENQADQADAV